MTIIILKKKDSFQYLTEPSFSVNIGLEEGGNTMYNEEMKRAYLNKKMREGYNEAYIYQKSVAFESIEKYEEELKKDISEFSEREILCMYDEISGSLYTILSINGYLKDYVYEMEGSYKGFSEITQPILKKRYEDSIKKEIITYADVQGMLEKLENPVDKFILYGLFCGVKGEKYVELVCSSMADADPKGREIWLAKFKSETPVRKGRLFYADAKLYQFAQEASEANYYIQQATDGGLRKVRVKNNNADIYKIPLTTQVTEKEDMNTVRCRGSRRLTKILNILQINDIYSPIDFFWCGMIYHIQKLAIENGVILNSLDNTKVLKQLPDIDKIEQQYQIEITSRNFKERMKRYS